MAQDQCYNMTSALQVSRGGMHNVRGIEDSPRRYQEFWLSGYMLQKQTGGSPGSQAKVGGRTGGRSTEPKDKAENREPELSKSRASVTCRATRTSR